MKTSARELVEKFAAHGVTWPTPGYEASRGPVDWTEAVDGREVQRLSLGLRGAGESTHDTPGELGAAAAGWLAEHAYARLYLVAVDGDQASWSEARQFWFDPADAGFSDAPPLEPGEAIELHAGRVALGRLIAWVVSQESWLDVWLVGVARGRAVVVQAGSSRGVSISWREA